MVVSPSSVSIFTPAARMPSMPASSLPSRLLETQPEVKMGMRELRLPDSRTAATDAPESRAGEVLGIMTRPVMPPLMAASEPEAMFSFCSWPGSRRCTWASKKPGQRMPPLQSMVRVFLGAAMPLAIFRMIPSWMSTSAFGRLGELSEATRAFCSRRFMAAMLNFKPQPSTPKKGKPCLLVSGENKIGRHPGGTVCRLDCFLEGIVCVRVAGGILSRADRDTLPRNLPAVHHANA